MRGESTRRAVTGGADPLTGRDRVNEDRHQVNMVAVEEVLQNVGSLPEEALKGPGLLPGVVEGRVGGGRREGGGGRRLVGEVLLCVRLRWGRGGEEGEVAEEADGEAGAGGAGGGGEKEEVEVTA